MAVLRPQKKVIVRYIVFLIFIGIIPLFLLGFLSYNVSSNSLLEAEERSITTLLRGQHDRLVLQLDQVENLIANITGVEEITKVLDDQEIVSDAYTSLVTQARIGYILNGYLNLEGLLSIDIFTEGGAHYYVGDTLNSGEINQDLLKSLKQEAIASERQIYWAGIRKNIHFDHSNSYALPAVSIITVIDRVTRQTRPIAMIIVSYSQEYLDQNSLINEPLPGSNLKLLDQHGQIIFSNNPERVGQPVAGVYARYVNQQQSNSKMLWQGESYLIKAIAIPEFNWQLINVIPEQVLLSNVTPIRNWAVFLLLISICLVALAMWLFTRNILTPIRQVIQGYQKLQNNQFDLKTRLPVRTSDEIGELINWFNNFLDNLEAQHRSEEALRESEGRYQLVVNASHEVLWDWDLLTDSFYLSPRFIFMIGEQANTPLTNKTSEWFGRIHEDDRAMVMQEFEQHLGGQSPHFECEYRLLKVDGSFLWVLSHGLAEFDENGKAVRIAGSHTDISARKAAEEKLRHDAFHDVMTGLYNRAWFVNYLDVVMKEYNRNPSKEFAVLFLDLDQFKSINDTLGHAVGDELLIQVSKRLKDCLRETDQLARLGGDEFVVLLENATVAQYKEVANRILTAVSRPFGIKDHIVMSGVSIGICIMMPGYQEPNEILRDADIAMYEAKKSGKNRFVLFDINMREDLVQRKALEEDLKKAIQNNQLELHYQPLISLQTGSLVGCEALIRWHHPEKGMVSPEVFIPLAESSDLIFSIGQWVLETACRQWQQWKTQFTCLEHLTLSINISSLQFDDKNFVGNLANTLAESGIQGSNLAFEITETALVRDMSKARRVINRFKKLGIDVHLDDFGTGYSSLSHLSEFPIDLIKIDRSFVDQCLESEKYMRIVRGILDMAQELGIQCTAEGIETREQLELLKNNDCEFGQGYFISKPLPADQMFDLLTQDQNTSLIVKEGESYN